MKRMYLILALLIITVISFAQITNLTAVTEEWQDCTHADGTGLYWEILKLVYEPEGITVNHGTYPYARAQNMVQTKEADILVGPYLDEIEQVIYSKHHIDNDLVFAVFKKDKVADWKGKESLKGTIGWVRGYAYDKYLGMKLDYYEVNNTETGLKMLNAGRLDFFLDAEAQLEPTFESGELNKDDFRIEEVLKLPLHLAFTDNAKGKELKEIYEKRMDVLIKSGELKKLFEKWDFDYIY
ncbi:MAG: transporter substrate-binding domain-containing protein [Candidatus Cloacimonetes bacterium]|nr:transporter substrate-binding domain-containing protein [Candidatus Cloacimonadota bacterium]